ncbi:MAG: hypothetical protein HY593_05915 [Candidatus Omnitrophica bacterium]|nr:hypothetical protein [Candidatus Omnitrophota bacterium]
MKHAVLLGDPSFFRIKGGKNPYTRTRWGFKKKVDRVKAISQWKRFKETIESLGAHIFVLPPQREYPGAVFPANAGFLFPKYELLPWGRKRFYLSHLAFHRKGEEVIYRDFFISKGLPVEKLPYAFEGEADFFPCGEFYIFSYGRMVKPGFRPRLGWPPYEYRFSHRSDKRNADFLQRVIGDAPLVQVCLTNVRCYHGDTALFAFGRNRECLLAYRGAMDSASWEGLERCWGRHLFPLSQRDAENFTANSFQLDTPNGPHVVFPEGVSAEVRRTVSSVGLPYTCVDVSEFFTKGGGSVKCLLCDLGPYVEK